MNNRKEKDPIQFNKKPNKKQGLADNEHEDPVPTDEIYREEQDIKHPRSSKKDSRSQ